jgi:hypothetical protein
MFRFKMSFVIVILFLASCSLISEVLHRKFQSPLAKDELVFPELTEFSDLSPMAGIERHYFSPTDYVIDENFDGGSSIPGTWTIIDGDADGYLWAIYTASPYSSPNSAGSRYNAAGNDDWLITPAISVASGYSLSFWYASQDPDYLDDLRVKISTTTAAPSAFTTTLFSRNSCPTTWNNQVVSLSSYVGSTVYIAFQNVSVDMFFLKVDNVKIGSPPAHDIVLTGSTAAQRTVPPASYTPSVSLRNDGGSTETFNITCTITHGVTTAYTQTVSVSSLAPGATRTVSFPSTSSLTGNYVYSVTYNAVVAGDANPSDNTQTHDLYTYNTHRRKVLIQEFTSVYCGYCPRAAEGLHMLEDEIGEEYMCAAYHSTTSFGSDPFYLASTAPIATYYGVSGYPTVVVGGMFKSSGGTPGPDYGYTAYLSYFNTCNSHYVPYTIDVFVHSVTGSGCGITTTVNRVGELPSGADIRLRYAVIERDKAYSWGSSPLRPLFRIL